MSEVEVSVRLPKNNPASSAFSYPSNEASGWLSRIDSSPSLVQLVIFFSALSRASTAATSGAPTVSSQRAPASSGLTLNRCCSNQALLTVSGDGMGVKRPDAASRLTNIAPIAQQAPSSAANTPSCASADVAVRTDAGAATPV